MEMSSGPVEPMMLELMSWYDHRSRVFQSDQGHDSGDPTVVQYWLRFAHSAPIVISSEGPTASHVGSTGVYRTVPGRAWKYARQVRSVLDPTAAAMKSTVAVPSRIFSLSTIRK